MYQQQQQRNLTAYQQHTPLQEQDWGNLVLSEMKRISREYTTAALEATHPAIRQTFQSLAQRTMQEQAELFTVLSQLNGYGSVKMADQQEIHQELQQQIQKAEQLQALVQQSIQSSNAGAGMYQQQMQQGYQQAPSFQQQQQPHYSSYEQQQGGYRSSAAQGASYLGSTASAQGQQASSGQVYGQSYGSASYGSANYGSAGYGTASYGQSTNQNETGSVSAESVGSPSSQTQGQGQNSSYGYTSPTGAAGFSYNQNPTTQSVSNEYSGSAIRSSTEIQDYNTGSKSQQGSAAGRLGSSLGGYQASSAASSARGGNSYNWTEDGDANETTENRGGNSYDWTASDDNGASNVSSSQERSANNVTGKYTF